MALDLLRRLAIDRAIGYSLVGRVWQTISGPVTISLIIVSLTPVQQGVYYTLVSIVSLQAFVELGLLNVVISYCGYESSKLLSPANVERAAEPDRLRHEHAAHKIASLIAGSTRWFACMSFVYAVAGIIFGIWTFSNSAISVPWLAPLVALLCISAASVAISPLLAVLEGVGQREDIYKCRTLQAMSGSLVIWLCLALGWGIWALVASATVQAAWSVYVTTLRHGSLLNRLRSAPRISRDLSWISEIVPAQWRMAIISLSYHLATQFLVVIVLKYHSPEDAGRLGLTLSVVSAIQIISYTWLQANFPVLAAKHGAGETAAAGTLWRQLAVNATAVLLIGLVVFWVFVAFLSNQYPRIGDRFLAPYQVAILAIGSLASLQLSIQGMYVLAKSKTPLARPAVAGFLVTGALVWIGGINGGVDGTIMGYAAGLTLVALPLHTAAYLVYSNRLLRKGGTQK